MSILRHLMIFLLVYPALPIFSAVQVFTKVRYWVLPHSFSTNIKLALMPFFLYEII